MANMEPHTPGIIAVYMTRQPDDRIKFRTLTYVDMTDADVYEYINENAPQTHSQVVTMNIVDQQYIRIPYFIDDSRHVNILKELIDVPNTYWNMHIRIDFANGTTSEHLGFNGED